MIKIGGTEIVDIAVGSTPIEKAYIGSQLVWEKSSPALPYDAVISYIESSGTQYIDPEVVSGNATDITMSMHILSADASKRLIGSSNTSFEYYLSSSSKLSVRSNNAATNSSKTPGTGGRHTYRISNSTNKYYYDSTSYNFTHNGTSYQGASLYLLIRPSTSSTGINARLYRCTINEGDTLLRDFIPVRKDGIGYLYDRVSGELFGNAGTGSFTLGSDVT